MTPSLPVPQDPAPLDAEQPAEGAHQPDLLVLPPRPPLPTDASAPAPADAPTKKPKKAPRAPREKKSAVDPGPPPPLPADVLEADIVVPPKPPLPAEAVDVPPPPPLPGDVVELDEPAAEPVQTEDQSATVEPETVGTREQAETVEPESAADSLEAEATVHVGVDVVEADVLEPALDDPAPAAVATVDVPEVLAVVEAAPDEPALVLRGISKSFGGTLAVDGVDLTVPAGTFYGLVGPNGAGKTTTLSIIAGLLKPDRGTVRVTGIDARENPLGAKRRMGVLPDRLRTFDRLTGRQLLYYYGVLRGLPPAVVESRTADLARAFDLTDALGRVVADYSAGMAKKVMLAGAMIHSPRLLVLDEPFEAVDPVSSAIIIDILSAYVAHGGTVILSSHGMELVERMCSRVAVLVAGQVLAEGTVDEVRGELSLEQRFIELAGGLSDVEGLEWLHTFSD